MISLIVPLLQIVTIYFEIEVNTHKLLCSYKMLMMSLLLNNNSHNDLLMMIMFIINTDTRS